MISGSGNTSSGTGSGSVVGTGSGSGAVTGSGSGAGIDSGSEMGVGSGSISYGWGATMTVGSEETGLLI